MSIRARLVILSFVVALLPAIPLTMLVKTLLEKSFAVGLSETVGEALQSGVAVSRVHLDVIREAFEKDVERVVATLDNDARTTAAIESRISGTAIDGFVIAASASAGGENTSGVPRGLRRFFGDPEFAKKVGDSTTVVPRGRTGTGAAEYYDSTNRSLQLAEWKDVLFYDAIDAEFVDNADRAISGLQIFAGLRLAQGNLNRSFFYPFIIIYAVMLGLSLVIALVISQRLSKPIRGLANAAHIVAEGDWSYRLDVKASGETKRLVDAFNAMVSQLDDQKRRLMQSERIATWREIARYLAHEIKNPLLPIRLTAQELRDQYPGGDARFQKILDESTRVIGDEVDHLTRLVKEFSSFARMPELKKSQGSLHHLIEDVSALYTQIDIRLELDAHVPELEFDSDQLRRVFVNLFENVVAVAGPSRDERKTHVTVTTSIERSRVVIEFADNGPGMTQETLDKVFEPYFTTRGEGTGLGLAVVKSIVELHGGSVAVRSQPDEGAVFRIVMPARERRLE